MWNACFGATKIAFVNFQTMQLGSMAKANDNSFVKLREVSVEELEDLTGYDMVFINGMGLKVVEEQRALIQRAADKGIPVYTSMATNPANNICTVDSVQGKQLRAYLSNGGKRNYRNLLNYVRSVIDGKLISAPDAEAPVEKAQNVLYHAGVKNPDDELDFLTVADYEKFLRENGLYKEGTRRIVITGQMADATGLIAALEKAGHNVYPVSSFTRFMEFVGEIGPDAVINLPHGRMGDEMVAYLQARNIPLFAPLTINSLVEDWEKDPMGMSGGFLSQSVVTPEIDGAIRPYALFAQYKDDEGLQHSFAIPERLEKFVTTVNNYLSLKTKPNSEKRVVVVYYKGPGQGSLTAGGMEVIPSLYNMLCRMKAEGYRVDNLPANAQGLAAKMTSADNRLNVDRLTFGNVVLMPQGAAGKGENSFQMVHGTNAAPPQEYIDSYLWMQNEFKADALIHFGTHGSLEFTPKKQVALSSNDWPDRLVGNVPHFYIYSIGNVGEGMIAKRRSYAGLQSYLTPPFLESSVRGIYRELMESIKIYNNATGQKDRASLAVKALTVRLGIHRELGLDSLRNKPYSEADITRIENFAEELATEKITGQLYTMGVAYEPERITSSVYAMATEPIAYSLFSLDKQRGQADESYLKHRARFTQRYLDPARALVGKLMGNPALATDELICRTAGITPQELMKARAIEAERNAPQGMMAMMMAASAKKEKPAGAKKEHPAGMPEAMKQKMKEMPEGMSAEAMKKMAHGMKKMPEGKQGMPAGMKGMPEKKEYSKAEIEFALAVLEVERTIRNIGNYRTELAASPEKELASLINAMNGGYTAPSPGGDPIANPNTLPTGRNMYAINAEATPTESAWEKGIALAKSTIETYQQRHNDSIPRKVSYTLWSGEFIETGGATIAQVLYMLGVEPIRDAFGRVSDLRLIPSKELGRPRIDVVVQTSGQLRDLAASRLFLINRAVEMAAAATDDVFENQVADGVHEAERALMEKGVSPKEAREMSAFRVFGGANGSYGTGIQGMVQAGDRWEKESEIAATYLNNMGAYYGNEKNWEAFRQYAFEAALTRTDVVIQPRQSNTWGALSLDHVYEFMGGMNLAVRNVTGKDPDAYFSDYRNRNRMRMQELKESIGVESRTTLLNPAYIKEKMKGEASSAAGFAEIVTNTYGWNVMKPAVIDKELWDDIYKVYVKDELHLGVQDYFEKQNPAALQEVTAVMMETARKGMWKASAQQLKDIAELHTDLVAKYGPSSSGMAGNNSKLQQFIATKVAPQAAASYNKQLQQMKQEAAQGKDAKGMVLEKQSSNLAPGAQEEKNSLNGVLITSVVLVAFIILLFILRKKRKKNSE